jgi:hypothetical protein
MALRESLWGAASALRARPELFVLGGVLGFLQAGLYGVVAVAYAVVAPETGVLGEGVAVVFSLFVVRPLYVGLYELTLRPRPAEPSVAALRRAVATAVRRYPAALRAAAAAAVASLPFGTAAALAWYVAATAGRYARYRLGDPGAPAALESAVLLVAAALIGAFLGSFLFRFTDCLAGFDGHDTLAAVASSAAAARRHLASLAGFAGVVVTVHLGFLGAVLAVAAAAPTEPGSPAPVSVLVAAAALYGVAVTLTGVLHASFYRELVGPVGASTDASPSLRRVVADRSSARVVLAVVLVVGLLAGASAVRTLDSAAHSSPELVELGTDDPDEAVRTAAATTAAANHRQVLYVRNASDPADDFRVQKRAGYDHADRRLYVYYTKRDGEEFGGFFADGTMALLRPGGRLDGLTAYERPPWQVVAAPGWGIADGPGAAESGVVPGGDTDGWRVVSANASTMVLRYDDPNTVDDAMGSSSFGGMTEPMANESHVTAIVDRERGVLESVRFHLHSLETGQNRQYRLEYREVGTADLERPAPISERRLAERLWDAVYY